MVEIDDGGAVTHDDGGGAEGSRRVGGTAGSGADINCARGSAITCEEEGGGGDKASRGKGEVGGAGLSNNDIACTEQFGIEPGDCDGSVRRGQFTEDDGVAGTDALCMGVEGGAAGRERVDVPAEAITSVRSIVKLAFDPLRVRHAWVAAVSAVVTK